MSVAIAPDAAHASRRPVGMTVRVVPAIASCAEVAPVEVHSNLRGLCDATAQMSPAGGVPKKSRMMSGGAGGGRVVGGGAAGGRVVGGGGDVVVATTVGDGGIGVSGGDVTTVRVVVGGPVTGGTAIGSGDVLVVAVASPGSVVDGAWSAGRIVDAVNPPGPDRG